MDVIFMPYKRLLKQITEDHPALQFRADSAFKWSSSEQTILYNQDDPNVITYLLHELAHALLDHTDFTSDIALIKKERAAWEYAQEILAPQYKLIISNELVEDSLDSYRTWLHDRSLCPECAISAFQTKTDTYKCAACGCQWRANDARVCALRRYQID